MECGWWFVTVMLIFHSSNFLSTSRLEPLACANFALKCCKLWPEFFKGTLTLGSFSAGISRLKKVLRSLHFELSYINVCSLYLKQSYALIVNLPLHFPLSKNTKGKSQQQDDLPLKKYSVFLPGAWLLSECYLLWINEWMKDESFFLWTHI